MTVISACDPLKALPDHQEWLRTTLLARLGSVDEVEEVMQEVAIAAATQSRKCEPVERVAPWLYRVALRQMLLFRRKAGRRKKLIANAAQVAEATTTDSKTREPVEWLIGQERQSEVRAAMGSMTERDRQLLMLKYVDGLSYAEIAERVGVTASSVQSRLHRARALLRAQLLKSPS
jgi:RNA polymerase sigma factor (sigma-70 family)